MKANIQIVTDPDSAIDISVTDAGAECLELRGLAHRAIPMLEDVSGYSQSDRLGLAGEIRRAIEVDRTTDDSDVIPVNLPGDDSGESANED